MVCKQPIINFTTVYSAGGLTDCHLVYHSILHTSWRISFTLYTFFVSVQGQVLRERTCKEKTFSKNVEARRDKSTEATCRNGSVQANQGLQRLHNK